MEPETVTIDGNVYTVGKPDTMKQFHVLRKIMPVASYLNQAFWKFKSDKPRSEEELLGMVTMPFAEALSRMSDEDTEFVIHTCLATCQKKLGNAYVPVMAGDGRTFMEPMELPTMLELTMTVIKRTFSSFFSTEEQSSPKET